MYNYNKNHLNKMPVIDYVFRAAQSCEVAEIFGLYVERVCWMDENNINQ